MNNSELLNKCENIYNEAKKAANNNKMGTDKWEGAMNVLYFINDCIRALKGLEKNNDLISKGEKRLLGEKNEFLSSLNKYVKNYKLPSSDKEDDKAQRNAGFHNGLEQTCAITFNDRSFLENYQYLLKDNWGAIKNRLLEAANKHKFRKSSEALRNVAENLQKEIRTNIKVRGDTSLLNSYSDSVEDFIIAKEIYEKLTKKSLTNKEPLKESYFNY